VCILSLDVMCTLWMLCCLAWCPSLSHAWPARRDPRSSSLHRHPHSYIITLPSSFLFFLSLSFSLSFFLSMCMYDKFIYIYIYSLCACFNFMKQKPKQYNSMMFCVCSSLFLDVSGVHVMLPHLVPSKGTTFPTSSTFPPYISRYFSFSHHFFTSWLWAIYINI